MYDVPKGVTPVSIEFHDSMFSGGVEGFSVKAFTRVNGIQSWFESRDDDPCPQMGNVARSSTPYMQDSMQA